MKMDSKIIYLYIIIEFPTGDWSAQLQYMDFSVRYLSTEAK